MIILGIDPGLATVGIGVVETGVNGQRSTINCQLVDFCTIETSPSLSAPERLHELAGDLGSILKKHRPDLAVVEKLYFETNRKTAMQVAEARGVILLTLQEHNVPVFEPTPLELKLAVTGDGQADKEQLRKMLTQILCVSDAAFAGGKDDATDAVALAVYGALYQSRETLDREKGKVRIAA